MAEIVNLRRVRKVKAKQAADQTAAENRVTFGRTKVERAATKAEIARAERQIEAHRRTVTPETGSETGDD